MRIKINDIIVIRRLVIVL